MIKVLIALLIDNGIESVIIKRMCDCGYNYDRMMIKNLDCDNIKDDSMNHKKYIKTNDSIADNNTNVSTA